MHSNMFPWCPLRLVATVATAACLASANNEGVASMRRNLYTVDCSQFQQVYVVDKLQISFTSLLDQNVGPNGYLHAEVIYAGQAWVALGTSQNSSGKMVIGNSIIGVPAPFAPFIPAYNPGKYNMTEKTPFGVKLMPDSLQTLQDANITQNATHTILRFTKRLIEPGQHVIQGDGENTFQVAYGFSNFLSLHQFRTAFNFTLSKCINGAVGTAPTPATLAPSPSPTVLTAAPTPNRKGQRVNCNEYQQSLAVGGGAVQMSFTSILDSTGINGWLRAQVIYTGQAWVGWGISGNRNGIMVPGEAVIGIPGATGLIANPGKYSLTGFTLSGVNLYPSSQQTLENSTIFQNSTHTILTFAKRLQEGGGEYDINGNGLNFFYVAWGTSNTLGDHGYNGRQSFEYQLYECINGSLAGTHESGAIFLATSSYKTFWNAHGVLSAVAWGILAPLAIGASLLRHYLTSDKLPVGLWFKIHQYFMLTVLLLTVLSFSFAVVAIQKQGTQQHFKQIRHRTTGLAITIMTCIQVLGGLLRPHLPHHHHGEDEDVDEPEEGNYDSGYDNGNGYKTTPVKKEQVPVKKPAIRLFWEICHRLMGTTLLAFSWWQVQDGLNKYAVRFAVTNLTNIFWGVTGGISAIIAVLYVIHLMQSKPAAK